MTESGQAAASTTPELALFRSEAIQFLKQALDEQQRCSAMYAREIDVLRQDAKNRDSGTASMVAFLQNRMKAVETDHAHVAGKLDAFLANESARIAAIDADCAGKVSAAQAQAAMQVANLKRKLDETEAQLTALTTFRDEKDAVEGELERLTREATERELAFRKRTELMERQHRTELVKVRQQCLAEITSIHETSRGMAENDLAAESKQLRVERVRLHSELRFHEAQTQRLLRDNDALNVQLRELQQALEIQNEKERHYAARGAQQQRQIRELSRKIDSAENDAVYQTLRAKKEIDDAQMSGESELAALRIEAGECRALVTLRNRELQQMRMLSRAILAQRTQVERFFHEAVQDVRAQRQKEREPNGKAKRRAAGDGYLDLEASERARILHVMFARLKGRRANTTQVPLHSFQTVATTRLPPPYAEREFRFVTENDH